MRRVTQIFSPDGALAHHLPGTAIHSGHHDVYAFFGKEMGQ
jgi:hypothetical protein